jgi:hypothetical protein
MGRILSDRDPGIQHRLSAVAENASLFAEDAQTDRR